jgi:hypothetical protein
VNHYYASSPWCRLYLLVSRDHDVQAVLGLERMPFRYGSQEITVGFATNYHSLERGAGGFLFLHWMKNCDLGISFGGSEDTHRIIRSRRWPYFDGVREYLLNNPYETYAGQPVWKRAAKWIARHSTRRPIGSFASKVPPHVRDGISVEEESIYSDDLLPKRSPFEFRLAPSAEYLAWRYNTQLSFVRYRLFRIVAGRRSVGYVILNEKPDRLLIAQCDGDDAEMLAWGVLMSIVKVGALDRFPRTVLLTCCHPGMQRIYRRFGFQAGASHPFALGPVRRGLGPKAGSTPSNWLINCDWGDNGLLDVAEDGSRGAA